MSTKKTGWEALENWVGDSAGAAKDVGSATVTAGKTGWEALDKWVSKDAPTSSAAESAAAETSSGGGFMGWLKRLFGGK